MTEIWTNIVSYLAAASVVLGCLVMLIACIGMARLPDFYTRSHSIGKGMTLGISLLLIGVWLANSPQVSGLKIFIAISFQFVTIPVASHLLMQLAYRRSRRGAQNRNFREKSASRTSTNIKN